MCRRVCPKTHVIEAHAAEQERLDVLRQRQAWFDGLRDRDPADLIFVHVSGTCTAMACRYGRCLRGERLRMSVPHGHGKSQPSSPA